MNISISVRCCSLCYVDMLFACLRSLLDFNIVQLIMDLLFFVTVDVWSEFMLATFHLICDDNMMFLHTTLKQFQVLACYCFKVGEKSSCWVLSLRPLCM